MRRALLRLSLLGFALIAIPGKLTEAKPESSVALTALLHAHGWQMTDPPAAPGNGLIKFDTYRTAICDGALITAQVPPNGDLHHLLRLIAGPSNDLLYLHGRRLSRQPPGTLAYARSKLDKVARTDSGVTALLLTGNCRHEDLSWVQEE